MAGDSSFNLCTSLHHLVLRFFCRSTDGCLVFVPAWLTMSIVAIYYSSTSPLGPLSLDKLLVLLQHVRQSSEMPC